jgi:type VI secretion system secreted protein VgrG
MQVVIEAAVGLTLKVGGNFITLDPSGIAISGAPLVQINSAGSALTGSPGSLVSPLCPTAPAAADQAVPGANTPAPGAHESPTAKMTLQTIAPAKDQRKKYSAATGGPTHDPNQNQDKTHWIEIELLDEAGNPVTGEPYRVTLPDGSTADGTTDDKGRARIEHIDAGSCQVTFPNLDQDAWS